MNCPFCQHRTDILANFCSNCGADLNSIYGLVKDRKYIGDYLPLDIITSAIAGCGVPALMLKIAVKASGQNGAAGLTSGLKKLGFGGMAGGIVTLGVCAAAVFVLIMLVWSIILTKATDRAHKNGDTKRMMNAKACGYPVSKLIRRRLVERIRKY